MGHFLNQTFTCEGNTHVPTGGDVARLIIIIIIMILIIVGNVCCLVVFNSPTSRKHFTKRVRYAMNSLCVTDLSMGLLVCPSTLYPAIHHCWPAGETFCKIEALLLSALFHESTLNMLLIAVDRYFLIHYTTRYNRIMTSRRYMFVIIGTWVVVFLTYAIVIFASGQFYFDEIGINCEPYYINSDVTISVISIFYFLPTFIFIFCYVSIYRTATKRRVLNFSPDDKHEKWVNANIRTSKYLAAITFGFFAAVSPWNLCTLIIVAASVRLNETVDYAVTWLAISNSFWNCLIYGVTNRKFRMAAARFACGRWVKSLRAITSTSKSEDSKDFSDNSILDTYRRKLSSRVRNKNKELSMTTSPGPTPGQTPNISPNATPRHSPSPSPQASPRPAHKGTEKQFGTTLSPDSIRHLPTSNSSQAGGNGHSKTTTV